MSEPSKRDAILRATKELLWERGFAAMSPRDVMTRSGAGQGSLYHHFSGKLDLACAALEDMAAEEKAAFEKIFDSRLPPLARIDAYLSRERDALRGCRLARLANEAAIADPKFRASVVDFLQSVESELGKTLAEAKRSGALKPEVDESALAALLLAAVEGGFVLARAFWDPEKMKRALEGARHMLALLKI